MHVEKKAKAKSIKAEIYIHTLVPLSPDDLTVPSRLFPAIFLNADNV